ncbi:MAG: DUF4258 domain-containing protein [Anaerolineae bacterium]|nr:DUF4258 domain-containing protein [Anaerolineae bacterium]
MDIETVRQRLQAGNYLIKSHAVQHALKEGFERKHMVEAILNGQVIEDYPDDQRMLICGRTKLIERIAIYLHIVCEYADPVFIEIVTAYIPDERLWESPPSRRRKRLKR